MKFELTKKNITLLELENFQNEIGVLLPESYKKHILKYNGGFPSDNLIITEEDEYIIDLFYSIKYGNNNIEKLIEVLKDNLPTNYFPFAESSGGNPFCIDLSSEKIYYCPMDMGEVIPEFVADSFQDLLDGLHEQN